MNGQYKGPEATELFCIHDSETEMGREPSHELGERGRQAWLRHCLRDLIRVWEPTLS